ELEDGHLSAIAPAAIGELQNAGVTARALLVTLSEHSEKLRDDFIVTGTVESQTASGRSTGLTESDQTIHHTADFFRLLNGRDDLLFLDHAVGHVLEHGNTVRGVSSKFTTVYVMAHLITNSLLRH